MEARMIDQYVKVNCKKTKDVIFEAINKNLVPTLNISNSDQVRCVSAYMEDKEVSYAINEDSTMNITKDEDHEDENAPYIITEDP